LIRMNTYAVVVPSDEGAFELGTDGPTSIVVGVDGSVTSARAAWYATGLARRQHARVTFVYVGPVSSLAASVPGGADLEVARWEAEDRTAEDMRRRPEEFGQELGVEITFVAVRGDPFAELCRIAGEIRADAVVVGASAQAGHRFIGSLAVRLVKAARWPVTVVP
jgi:nucleotide-binding universal stress UspA family protein